MLVVVFGFSTAFFLINSSYVDWQASPIATSISTHPISELDFPTVTVCPPKGSNTVLNYDLLTAVNKTFDDETKNEMLDIVMSLSKDYYHEKYE